MGAAPDERAGLAAQLADGLVPDTVARMIAKRALDDVTGRRVREALVSHQQLKNRALRIGYVSYGQRFSEEEVARDARALFTRRRPHEAPRRRSVRDWRTGHEDGGLWASSVRPRRTGEGFDRLTVDDPIKAPCDCRVLAGAAEGLGVVQRRRVHAPRADGSCFVIQTRWHEDDLAGRLIRDGWEHVTCRPRRQGRGALAGAMAGRAPAQFRRRSASTPSRACTWGLPARVAGRRLPRCLLLRRRPAGDADPDWPDFAYSTKRHADYSVAVVLGEAERALLRAGRRAPPGRGTGVPERGAPLRWTARRRQTHRVCKRERAWARSTRWKKLGLKVDARTARGDKFSRAQPVAAAWNAGRVLVPRKASWLEAFLGEVCGFTGVKDVDDDQVDAPWAPSTPSPSGRARTRAEPIARPDHHYGRLTVLRRRLLVGPWGR